MLSPRDGYFSAIGALVGMVLTILLHMLMGIY